jgi:hypothetical protein
MEFISIFIRYTRYGFFSAKNERGISCLCFCRQCRNDEPKARHPKRESRTTAVRLGEGRIVNTKKEEKAKARAICLAIHAPSLDFLFALAFQRFPTL